MKTADRAKVFVAMSGGVDSSTSAALLLERGFDCAGIFMVTNDLSQHAQADAETVAVQLGIELFVLDLREDFERIIEYFCGEYERGRTPNPCVVCNRVIKFGKLMDFARSHGGDYLATGHYARVLSHDGLPGLYEAGCAAKDQSYVLSMIDRDVLGHLILPMGDYSKDESRAAALGYGLATAAKEDSQEICFIPNDDYVALLERRCPQLRRKGNIIDSTGKVLGEHDGIHRFTIGQRRGLGVAMGIPYYVTRIDARSNTVTLGPKAQVMAGRLRVKGVNWLVERPAAPFHASVKIRYNSSGAGATVTPKGEDAVVEFERPSSAITPGQLAVFYTCQADKRRVLGAGWIDKTGD